MKHLGLIRVLLCLLLLLPRFVCAHHLLSITPATPFPATVHVLSATTATYNITNLASKVFVTAINQSIFPCPSGMQIIASTCGTPMAPGQSCQLTISFNAPSSAQVLHAELRAWAQPSADGVRYPFSITVVQPQQFTVTPNAGANGSIAPATPQTVSIGASVTFTATPDAGYEVDQWLLDGVESQTGGSTFTLNNVMANHTVTVTFGATTPLTVGTAYQTFDTDAVPIVYTSSDGGNVWTRSSALTFDASQPIASLYGVSCTGRLGKHCVSVGQSRDITTLIQSPIIYTTTDAGITWSTPIIVPTLILPGTATNGQLFSVSCEVNHCVTVGQAFVTAPSTVIQPLAYSSDDGGTTWSSPKSFTLPIGQKSSTLSAIECVGKACATVGSSTGGSTMPLAYSSSDGGNSWSLATTQPAGVASGQLLGISCAANHCTAVGNAGTLPLAYTSTDNGVNWSTPISLPLTSDTGILYSVSCVNEHCVAVGSQTTAMPVSFMPLAYTSDDGGHTWTQLAPAAFIIPSTQSFGALFSVTCNANHCLAFGRSQNIFRLNDQPLAYKSVDGGTTWSLLPVFGLPSPQMHGDLFKPQYGLP